MEKLKSVFFLRQAWPLSPPSLSIMSTDKGEGGGMCREEENEEEEVNLKRRTKT